VQSASGAKAPRGGKIVIAFDKASDEFTASFKNASGLFAANAIVKTMKLEALDLNDGR
jgi:hypothetical protein